LTTTTKSRAAAANDSDRKWPLVWKGSFVFFEILLLTTIDDFSCNNKKCNKQTASTLFNVVGLGTQLGLFPPKKWHHFLGGKSCSQAPRPTTLKRVDAVCLLHFCCCRRGRRRQGPTSEKEKMRRRLCMLQFFWLGRVAFNAPTPTTWRRGVKSVFVCCVSFRHRRGRRRKGQQAIKRRRLCRQLSLARPP